jgi:hypothetical protein
MEISKINRFLARVSDGQIAEVFIPQDTRRGPDGIVMITRALKVAPEIGSVVTEASTREKYTIVDFDVVIPDSTEDRINKKRSYNLHLKPNKKII